MIETNNSGGITNWKETTLIDMNEKKWITLEEPFGRKWEKYHAIVKPNLGLVYLYRKTWFGHPKFGKKKQLFDEVIKIEQCFVQIEEVEISHDHFDNKAFQSDDRFFTTTETIKRYNVSQIKAIQDRILIGYYTEPKRIEY